MTAPFKKQVPKNPLAKELYRTQKKIHRLKIRLFLLFTLPIAVVTIGHAVLKEYIRIRVRQAAQAKEHAAPHGNGPESPAPARKPDKEKSDKGGKPS